jgi:hypothetical protein
MEMLINDMIQRTDLTGAQFEQVMQQTAARVEQALVTIAPQIYSLVGLNITLNAQGRPSNGGGGSAAPSNRAIQTGASSAMIVRLLFFMLLTNV